MREFIKVACVLVIIGCVVTASVAWIDDRPDRTTWLCRTIPAGVAIIALGIFLRIHWKRDLAPDFLANQIGAYLERDGFCFSFVPVAVDGTCVFRLLFQNRFEEECIARVAIRPVTFMRTYETLVLMTVRCPGGAFGVAERSVGVPAELQGKKVSFDVGADTEYPEGRGRMLRFKDSIVLRRNTAFVNAFARTTTVLALMGGMLLFHRPARVACTLPSNVATDLPTSVPEPAKVLWRPGDPLP